MTPPFRWTALFLVVFSALAGCRVGAGAGAGAEPATERGFQPGGLWKAGAASITITPDQPMWMAGYANRTNVSQGKATDLFAKVLALEDSASNRLVIVTLDLIGVPRSLRDEVQRACRSDHGLSPEQLLMNCSHTHSGPEFRIRPGPQDWAMFGKEGIQGAKSAEAYGVELRARIREGVQKAMEDLAPAQLSYQHARCGFAMNRRTLVGGVYQNFPNPDGPVDHDVPVLKVERPAGQLVAILFGYACHNTTLALYQFSGDYAGYAQQELQNAHPGAIALFLQGCGGDQNPYPRGTVELARTHGRNLATAVEAALVTKARPLSGALRVVFAEVDIDYATPPTREELAARLQTNGPAADHARRMLARYEREGRLPERYSYPVQLIRFGNELTLVALAGETCVDYAQRLKRELPGPAALWVAGYCNDVMAYIPSARLLREGGYEPRSSMDYSEIHPGPWAPSLEERIIGKVHELFR
ncbi:MAG TPA: neutral/alkaline non-lysosomal ceramidase N-terminal domain-containing protein [Verrucomicrobiae bacterium]|nr:neutral/alkaline non-lysosomal ceramidase N-terminal domain-containing protein [Verrucomicrobiae bacterium]